MPFIDPNALYWVCWRIEGDLCACSLASARIADAAECAEKVRKVWPEVWLELDADGSGNVTVLKYEQRAASVA